MKFKIKASWIIVLLIIIALTYFSQKIPQEIIRQYVEDAGMFGPLIFIFLLLLTFIIAPLSGSPITFVGFYLYEEKVVILSFFSVFLASIINFWIARIGGQKLVEKFAGKTGFKKINQFTKNYGYKALFLLRIFQGGIGDFISFAAGLTNMNFKKYLLFSTLGMIPGSLIHYWLSSKASNPAIYTVFSWSMVFSFSFIFIIVSIIKKYLYKKNETNS
jgi:uncharacterized membrane protein YdjX (TVP38/TMEM64 family)